MKAKVNQGGSVYKESKQWPIWKRHKFHLLEVFLAYTEINCCCSVMLYAGIYPSNFDVCQAAQKTQFSD